MESTGREFDLVAVDLFVTGQIPFFTTTVEFFDRVRQRLSRAG